MKIFENKPSTDTPLNAENLNANFNELNVFKNLWGNGNLYAQRDTSRTLTIPLDAGTYTFSWGELTKTSTEDPLFAFYNSSGNTIGYIYLSETSQTLILTDKAVSFRFYPAKTYDSSASQTANLKDIQLEKGSEKTSYTPYVGYIVDSGTNDNGSWIKYSDGTMIQYGEKTIPSTATNELVTLPESYINNKYSVILSPFFVTYINICLVMANMNESSFRVYGQRGNGADLNINQFFKWTTIGRWK